MLAVLTEDLNGSDTRDKNSSTADVCEVRRSKTGIENVKASVAGIWSIENSQNRGNSGHVKGVHANTAEWVGGCKELSAMWRNGMAYDQDVNEWMDSRFRRSASWL